MTVSELGEWARNGYPVRVDGQDLFLTTQAGLTAGSSICAVADTPFVDEKTNFSEARIFGIESDKVEVLLGKDGFKAITKHQLSP